MTDEQQRAFEQVYSDYYTRIYRRVYMLVRDPQEAEDLTQDTFLKAYNAFATLAAPDHLYRWLYRVATNAAYDVLRRRQCLTFTPLESDGQEESLYASGGDLQEDNATREAIQIAFDGLREKHQNILVLHAIKGYSPTEIAARYGWSYSKVTSTVNYTRHAFKRHYQAAVDAS